MIDALVYQYLKSTGYASAVKLLILQEKLMAARFTSGKEKP
ncbi:hypothetical protein [Paraburkholderia bannensis]|nr:hypothetical protein [Paraburkholderia bannensis]